MQIISLTASIFEDLIYTYPIHYLALKAFHTATYSLKITNQFNAPNV